MLLKFFGSINSKLISLCCEFLVVYSFLYFKDVKPRAWGSAFKPTHALVLFLRVGALTCHIWPKHVELRSYPFFIIIFFNFLNKIIFNYIIKIIRKLASWEKIAYVSFSQRLQHAGSENSNNDKRKGCVGWLLLNLIVIFLLV